jgi:hypothetical protein
VQPPTSSSSAISIGETGNFVGGDLSALTINLIDYNPDSKATLVAASAGTPMLLQIQHAATGSIGVVALCGQSPTSVAALNLHFTFGVKLISSK